MPQILNDNTSEWTKRPYSIKIGDEPKTYAEVIQEVLKVDKKQKNAQQMAKVIDELSTGSASLTYFTKMNVNDTSVGGSDVINPYWAFGVDDDIIHPITSSDGGIGNTGMGRVYSEMYDSNQQVLHLSFGVPEFTNLKDFYMNSGDSELAELMNKGTSSLGLKIGSLIGSVGKFAVMIPFLPIVALIKAGDYVMSGRKITKYYEFKSSMHLYYQMVNSILAVLSVSLGLYGNVSNKVTGGVDENGLRDQYNAAGIPEIMKNGPDVFAILDKRASRLTRRDPRTSEQMLKAAQSTPQGEDFFDLWGSLTTTLCGANDFIGFRIEKSTDSSESISNSIGESSIASTLNSMGASGKDRSFNIAGGNIDNGVFSSSVDFIKDVTKGLVSTFTGEGATNLVTGNGFYNIPEVWQNSSMSKSYSFNVVLRARAGDPVSYFQSICIPLAFLLAAALPRSIGKNMYTSPFVLQGYCKGMFSASLGMVDSMTIKRGGADHGWTINNLPTVVEVSFSIKDLSPAMFLGLAAPSGSLDSVMDVFKENTPLQDYLSTLSGLGLEERYLQMQQIKRKWEVMKLMSRNTLFNPYYWINKVGNAGLPRAIAACTPWSTVSEK